MVTEVYSLNCTVIDVDSAGYCQGYTFIHFTCNGYFLRCLLRRSEGGPRLNRLWTSSTPGAEKGLFRPCMHPAPMTIIFIGIL